jgi:hypothetical protein
VRVQVHVHQYVRFTAQAGAEVTCPVLAIHAQFAGRRVQKSDVLGVGDFEFTQVVAFEPDGVYGLLLPVHVVVLRVAHPEYAAFHPHHPLRSGLARGLRGLPPSIPAQGNEH